MLSAFDTTAQRLGTAAQNIEKDFWVCWTLDVLFNGLNDSGPRLLFKGGTSLSKGFGLISRFSEDIDVTVFRDDIGEPATIEEGPLYPVLASRAINLRTSSLHQLLPTSASRHKSATPFSPAASLRLSRST